MKAARVIFIICAVLLGATAAAAAVVAAVEPVRNIVLEAAGVSDIKEIFENYFVAAALVCAAFCVIFVAFVVSLIVFLGKKRKRARVTCRTEDSEAVAAARRAAVAELEAAKAVLDAIENGGDAETAKKGE